MKKLTLLLFLISGFFINEVSAQYKTAIGVRLGSPIGGTIKHFITEKSALEAFAGFGRWSTAVGAAYLYHQEIEEVENLRWYAGVGGGIRFWRSRYWNGGASVGGQVYGGLDYKFEELPLNVSFDIAPGLFFGDYRGGIRIWGGFAVRYVLGEGGFD